MEFEDQEEHEGDIVMGPSYNSLGNSNSTRVTTQMPSPAAMAAEPQSQRKPRYRECLKNHAVGIGGHAIDGCGEFLPAGAEGTLDALKCAACNCHRNFHRKENNGGGGADPTFHFHNSHQPLLSHHPHGQFSPFYKTPSGYLHVAPRQPRPLALPSTSGGGGVGGRSREEQEDMSNMNNSGMSSKKRFRTKFSQEQKEKLLELAERLGWRIQKQDEEVVQQFCNELGIRRHVFKVWMHNNKHTLAQKP